MLEPKQRKPDRWYEDVGIKDQAGVAGREIAGHDHLADMPHRIAEREDAGGNDRRKTQIEAPERSDEAHDGEAEACGRDFKLERAIGPADERRGHLAEKGVHDEIVKIINTDIEKNEPGEEFLDNRGGAHGLWGLSNRDDRKDQPNHQEGQRIVRQDEGDGGLDKVCHAMPRWPNYVVFVRRPIPAAVGVDSS
jgi:hypothetical protein